MLIGSSEKNMRKQHIWSIPTKQAKQMLEILPIFDMKTGFLTIGEVLDQR